MKAGKDFIGVSVAALILNGKNEVLLVKRAPACKFDAGKWTLIVGEVEYGESMEEALKREAMEEAGIEIKNLGMIQLVEIFPKETGVHWVGLDYLCQHIGGTVENKEPLVHEKLEWFPLDQLPEPLGASTKETVGKYLGHAKQGIKK